MRSILFLFTTVILSSCWKFKPGSYSSLPSIEIKTVWGSKPIYGIDSAAKRISYTNKPDSVKAPGNIYIKGNYIFQAEIGKGLHVIDNSTPSSAHRIGFITINGCSQISIKGNNLYSNNYDDLVVIDISDLNNLKITGRVKGAFPEGRQNHFYSQPLASGYYECPQYKPDSIIIDWRMDSVKSYCFKN